jgi:1-deoxy-D-xylulose-5-phosphate synthase
MAALRVVPNLTIASPMDECELRRLMFTAQLPDKGPFVIRYPRGRGSVVDWRCPFEEIPVGKGRQLCDGSDVAVVTIGPIGVQAAEAIDELGALTAKVAHYDLRFLKPLDEEMLHEIGQRFKKIVTIEDGVRKGGMGTAVMEWMSDHGYHPAVHRLGIPDHFVEHGTVEELRRIVGIDKESIKNAISQQLTAKNEEI